MGGVFTNMLSVGEDGKIVESGGLVLLISLALGTLIGELIRLDDRINGLGSWVEKRVKTDGFAKGFVSQVAEALTDEEIETLFLGPIVMTIELAVRFLSDYLDGSKYFKCDYEKHNLVRTKCQIALAKDMLEKINQTKDIIKKYGKKE